MKILNSQADVCLTFEVSDMGMGVLSGLAFNVR